MNSFKSRVVLFIFVLFSIISFTKAVDIIIITSNVAYQQDYIAFVQGIYGPSANITIDAYTELNGNASMLAELEAADLVIIARLNNSGDFDDGTENTDWSSLTTPLLCHSAYLTRENRWNWMTGDKEILNNNSANIVVADSFDPVFNGMDVADGDTIQFFTAPQNQVVVQSDSGNGSLVASPVGSNRVLMARWNDTTSPFHSGSPYTPGGERLFFATDEYNPLGTLSNDGKTLLTNAMLSLFAAEKRAITLIESAGNTIVSEKPLSSDSFSIVLNEQPSTNVNVIINPNTNINDIEIEGSSAPGQPITLTFTPANYNIAQQVTIWAVSDTLEEGTEVSDITFQVQSTDLNIDGSVIAPVQVTVIDAPVNHCPVGDLNDDCKVDIEDVRIFSLNWLGDAGSIADLNEDGFVDLSDFALLADNWLVEVDSPGPIIINEFMAVNSYIPFTNPLNIKTRVYGWYVNPDWIELYNTTNESVDIGGMYLTDDDDLLTQWRFPDGTIIGPNGYLIVYASGKTEEEYPGNYPYLDDFDALHTNFELSNNGEYLALVQQDGHTISHQYEYPEQRGLVSYGLSASGIAGHLITPTPGNQVSGLWTGDVNSIVYDGAVGDTKFSVKRGFYETSFEVLLSCETTEADIYFTTDSSEPIDIYGNPTATAKLYDSVTNKPQITTTTCLRAAAIKTGWLPSNIDTQTYIFTSDVLDQAAPGDYATSWGGIQADYKLEDDTNDIKEVAGDSNFTVNQSREVIQNALLAIPTLSVVANKNNLFKSSDAIYLNTQSEGINWERFCSAELFDPVEGSKFQLNCGIRVQGGASRNPGSAPKHSLSLRFRSGYGPGKLNHKLFPGSPVDSFNSLQLRAMYNNSWIHWSPDQRQRGSLIRDQWVRDALIDMGDSSAGNGTYVHLYLNGLYWGVYNLHERQEAGHYGEHYGVDSDTLDAISSGAAVDGNLSSWNALHNLTANAASDGNVDLTEYEIISQKLDMVNLCDYMIINQFGANADWDHHNWRSVGGGINNAPWRMYSWDAERVHEGVTASNLSDNNGGAPSRLFQNLRKSNEFEMLFADRIHRHFFNGGTLTAENAAQFWMNLANELDQAIIAESARWGDYRRDVHVRGTAFLYTRNDYWLPEQDRLMDSYFFVNSGLNRSEQMLFNQYTPGYYPSVDAPVFNINGSYQHGGYVATGDSLTMTNPDGSGTMYYTLDGSDPRLAGGAVNPTAKIFEVGSSNTDNVELVSMGAEWSYLYDGSDQGTTWQQLSFADGSWGSGNGELGFGDGDEATNIGPRDGHLSAYFRHKFTVADTSDFIELKINLKYDDGAVIYINEQEVDRINMPGGTINYDTPTLPSAVENATTTITGISPSVLTNGANILAVEIHQKSTGSSDISFDMSLNATASTTGGNPSQEILSESTQVKARVLDGSTWSALNDAVYAVGAVLENLRISEIMYHPADPNTEYIELTNIGTKAINLNKVTFTRGINYTFPSLTLAPDEYVLVVGNLGEFEAAYDTTGLKIAGQYVGSLANAGEKIELKDAISQVIHLFDYNDGWYDITDGQGFSLTIKDAFSTDLTLWDSKGGWRPSAMAGGSPGYDDSGLLPPLGAVVINEILAHSHALDPDWIELHNTTSEEINIGGWFLSDNNNNDPNIMKYEIPLETIIPANGYVVFYEDTSFGSSAANKPFALSEAGETLYLHSGQGGVITGYMEQESFGATESNVALGRYYKASTDTYNFVAMSLNTPAQANAAPKVGPIVISEIMFNPPAGGSFDHDEYEYVELLNITDFDITLQSYDALLGVDVPWKFTNGIDYTFPLGTVIKSGQRLVIARNTAAFTARYGALPNVIGPYSGQLSNGGEKVDLSLPGDEEDGDRYYIRVDRINYSDGSHPEETDPWPVSADGTGDALGRINDELYGNDYTNWKAVSTSPGS